jgi:hypothetical protein
VNIAQVLLLEGVGAKGDSSNQQELNAINKSQLTERINLKTDRELLYTDRENLNQSREKSALD